MPLTALLLVLVGYTVGSIPFGYLLARWLAGIDVRLSGSGNIGAANVARTAGLRLGLTAALLDAAKGAVPVLLALGLHPGDGAPAAAGFAAVIGHIYPAWLRFRGGKGVATACGAFAVLAPLATAVAAAGFVATIWLTRYVSLGSLIASVTLPPAAWATGAPAPVVLVAVIAAAIIIQRHRRNLERLWAGTERRLERKAEGGRR